MRREAVISAHHYGIHVRPYRNTTVADVSGAGSVAQNSWCISGNLRLCLGCASERVRNVQGSDA